VCVESRKVVRRLFRLPLLTKTECGRPLAIWINPESDHFFLRRFDADITTFPNFIIDLKTSNPQRKGILHIAFNSRCRTSVPPLKALSVDLANDVLREITSALRGWVLGLKSIWFIDILCPEFRLIVGPISENGNWAIKGLDRSIPLFPHAVEFDLFEEDIRPCQSTFESDTILHNPKAAMKAWEAMENKLGIRSDAGPQPAHQISHILAMTARHGYHYSAYAANHGPLLAVKAREDGGYLQHRWGYLFFPSGGSLKSRRRISCPRLAFGYFPTGTFDTPDEKLAGKACQDLSGQRPGLGLFDL
ncbi:unnamed protein product, partial [Clonostachys chloroleuca]